MNKIKIQNLIKGIIKHKAAVIIVVGLLTVGGVLGGNKLRQDYYDKKSANAPKSTPENFISDKQYYEMGFTANAPEADKDAKRNPGVGEFNEETKKEEPVKEEPKQEPVKEEPKKEEPVKETPKQEAPAKSTNTTKPATSTPAPKPAPTPAPTPAPAPAPKPVEKPIEQPKPVRESGIDWELTNKFNALSFSNPYNQNPAIYQQMSNEGAIKVEDLIKLAQNLAFGGGIDAKFKTPWIPRASAPNVKHVYMEHTVNVVSGTSEYSYRGYKAISGMNAGFSYCVAYWDKSINNYKLYYVKIKLA